MTKTVVTPSLVAELKDAKEMLTYYRGRVALLRADIKQARLDAKIDKIVARNAREAAREEKRAEKIAKMEAKLLALKAGPVGTKAIKANKKPSKVKTTKFMTVVDQFGTTTEVAA